MKRRKLAILASLISEPAINTLLGAISAISWTGKALESIEPFDDLVEAGVQAIRRCHRLVGLIGLSLSLTRVDER